MTRTAVLGGGSPFTAALLRALRSQPSDEPDEVRLWGGDTQALRLLARHGTALLSPGGGAVTAHQDLAEALSGADVVVHQIRYRSLAGRAAAEDLASRWALPADETLGPGGLLTALSASAALPPVATALREHAPGATVVNMTNPLSVTTRLLHLEGVQHVVGSCELPETTARAAYALAGATYSPGGWRTTGLNHRGFVHAVQDVDGRDLVPGVVRGLAVQGDHALAADVVELGALPTKYFDLVRGRAEHPPGRAGALAALRVRILRELAADVSASPPSLAERQTPWYDLAVVPLVRALRSDRPRRLVLTLPDGQGLARERTCEVSAAGVVPLADPPAPPGVQPWLRRFEEHEQAVLSAVRSPSSATVRRALEADPSVPGDVPAGCATDLLDRLGA